MKKTIGDLTLRQFVEIIKSHCLEPTCKKCNKKHNAIYVICRLNFEYNFREQILESVFLDKAILDKEIEVDVDDV